MIKLILFCVLALLFGIFKGDYWGALIVAGFIISIWAIGAGVNYLLVYSFIQYQFRKFVNDGYVIENERDIKVVYKTLEIGSNYKNTLRKILLNILAENKMLFIEKGNQFYCFPKVEINGENQKNFNLLISFINLQEGYFAVEFIFNKIDFLPAWLSFINAEEQKITFQENVARPTFYQFKGKFLSYTEWFIEEA